MGSDWSDWTQSPRVVIVGLIDPIYWTATSSNTKPDPGSEFTTFARIFLLPNAPRVLPTTSMLFSSELRRVAAAARPRPLVKILQLIE